MQVYAAGNDVKLRQQAASNSRTEKPAEPEPEPSASGAGARKGKLPPGLPPGAVKLRGGQGYRVGKDTWKVDKLHKDHWDVTDKKGRKKEEVDFRGRRIWPRGPKNKDKPPSGAKNYEN